MVPVAHLGKGDTDFRKTGFPLVGVPRRPAGILVRPIIVVPRPALDPEASPWISGVDWCLVKDVPTETSEGTNGLRAGRDAREPKCLPVPAPLLRRRRGESVGALPGARHAVGTSVDARRGLQRSQRDWWRPFTPA